MGVPGVPKRRYDDEALRQRALELRAKGLSYREIARELGCSVFKVHQLISPYEVLGLGLGRFTSLLVGLKSSTESLGSLRA
jgi:transposase-like protein